MQHRPCPFSYALIIGFVSFTVSRNARAEQPCVRVAPWNHLARTADEFVEPGPLALTAASVLPLAVMAPTGADHELQVFSQRDLGGRYDLERVSLVAPFALAGGTLVAYGVSALDGACEAMRVESAVLQAMGASGALVLVLKLLVGRGFPTGNADPMALDRLEHPEYATHFEPFSFTLSAWPSGHAATMVAAAAAFRTTLPRAGIWRYSGYPLAALVSAGMWLSDRHWMSDLLSGALMGEAIGGSVGRAFLDAPSGEHAQIFFTPAPGGGRLTWGGRW